MKTSQQFYFILLFLGLVIVLNPIKAQELSAVPDWPEELRELPQNYKDNYKGRAYNYVESLSWLDRAKRWLIESLISWLNTNEKEALGIYRVLELIFYSLVIIGVIYLIIRIILNKEVRWIFKKNREKDNPLGLDLNENIQEIDFEALINMAVADKDFRTAIRYYYLLLLKKLDQFDVISFDAQKTTFDYQQEVEGTTHTAAFNKATHYYTYIWYGEFFIDEDEYIGASKVYQELLNQLAK